MNFKTLSVSNDDGVLLVKLNRPEAMNSFTVEMSHELVDLFEAASEDDEVGAIVLTGEGKAFCAGMDLSISGNVFGLDETKNPSMEDMSTHYNDPEYVDGVRDSGGKVTLSMFDCKKPIIVAFNGAAVGIGATMTLAADIRLASTKARIGFVFGKIGVTPEACSTWFLPRIVGMSKALEWVYSGDILTAEEAKDGGLVSKIYEPEALLDAATAMARKFIVGRSPVAIALSRQMMYRNSVLAHPREAHKVDSLAIFKCSLDDGKEGISAFLEKREPEFTSKASQMPEFYPWWEE
ncbi:MAG: enoyl-CoA hydratase/carnithine racemase [Candidatus Azotimanducaceae bacterium]|jgi:enoyl-CoA hydratase/carnithine racemase